MEDGNLAILVDAKTEYTKQLVNILSPFIYNGIKGIYIEAKEDCFERDELEETLRFFQKKLSEIPKWNQEVIDQEYENVIEGSKCDWLEDLIMAVFVSHTRILTSINFNKSKNKVNLKIPKVDHFIHQCYIEVARCFWKNPYLFDDTINKYEFQRNRREAEKLIENQIHETIRRQLPVKNILREYLGNEYKEVDDGEEEIENDANYSDNLRKLVKAEIENCSKEKLDKFNIDADDEEDNDEESNTNETNASEETTEESAATSEKAEATSEAAAEATTSEKATATSEKAEAATSEKAAATSEKAEAATSEKAEAATSEKATSEAASSEPAAATSEAATSEAATSEKAEAETSEALAATPNVVDEGELSDNEIENKEVTEIIDKEVEKLALEPFDSGLNVEELNFDFEDLNELEEVYQDAPKLTANSIEEQLNTNTNTLDKVEVDLGLSDLSPEQNIKLEVSEAKEEVKSTESEPAIKTIIIDTKKGASSNKIINDDNNMEINDFEDDEASDSDDETSRLKQQVYSRYSKKRDYSFFT